MPLGPRGAPNARAETRWSATRPSAATPNATEVSGPMSDARAGHGLQADTPGGGDVAAQLDRVKRKRAIGRMNPATRYSHADRNGPAMAASTNWAALAGGAEQTTTEAANRAKAHIRLPIMGDLPMRRCRQFKRPRLRPVETCFAQIVTCAGETASAIVFASNGSWVDIRSAMLRRTVTQLLLWAEQR
jgi:hypothetical protein